MRARTKFKKLKIFLIRGAEKEHFIYATDYSSAANKFREKFPFVIIKEISLYK